MDRLVHQLGHDSDSGVAIEPSQQIDLLKLAEKYLSTKKIKGSKRHALEQKI